MATFNLGGFGFGPREHGGLLQDAMESFSDYMQIAYEGGDKSAAADALIEYGKAVAHHPSAEQQGVYRLRINTTAEELQAGETSEDVSWSDALDLMQPHALNAYEIIKGKRVRRP